MYCVLYIFLLISACVIVDSLGSCVGLTVYNLDSSTTFSMGDIITVPNPLKKHTIVRNKVNITHYYCTVNIFGCLTLKMTCTTEKILSHFLQPTYTQDEQVEVKSVCITNPSQLLINGQKLSSDKLAPSTVSITAFS